MSHARAEELQSAVQVANTSSCNTSTCGTGYNYLAALSFNYPTGSSFNNTATAAQRAFSSGAFQVLDLAICPAQRPARAPSPFHSRALDCPGS